MTFSRGTDATEASRLSAYNASGVADQEFRDRAMLGAIETGSNRAKNADLARGAVLQNDLSQSFSQAKAAMTVSQAQASSIGAVAGAGVMKYDDHRQMQKLNAMMST